MKYEAIILYTGTCMLCSAISVIAWSMRSKILKSVRIDI
jgi:hypothetical protein